MGGDSSGLGTRLSSQQKLKYGLKKVSMQRAEFTVNVEVIHSDQSEKHY